jgi:hypothetical protein
VPIPRGCRRGLVGGHHVHFAQAGCGLQEIFGPTHGLTSKVFTTLAVLECSQVRQVERKEEMKPAPAITGV